MMSKWIGYAVSVNCGEPLGCYQGRILETDGATITLTKAFRNGFPYPKSKVTLNAADIKDLKIIEAKIESNEQTHSTVAVTKTSKKGHRATVCENLQANNANTCNQNANANTNNKNTVSRTASGPARSKPIDIQGGRGNKHNNNSGSFGAGGGGSTPRGRAPAAGTSGGSGGGGAAGGGATAGAAQGGGARRRNECFAGADDDLSTDFDFEKNLALFDKQALWDQMRNSHKPDVVRQTEKYRHDENVLGGGGAPPTRAIRLPHSLQANTDYLTDDGVFVPSLTWSGRALLWRELRSTVPAGGTGEAAVLLARSTADVALRLVGGGRRLDPRNTHQVPTVVALLGHNYVGASGAICCRLLASHGVKCVACGIDADDALDTNDSNEARQEMAKLSAYGVEVAHLEALPTPDLVLVAVGDEDRPEYSAAMSWCASTRGGPLRLEPAGTTISGGAGRAALWAALPGAHNPALARVLLANVAVPPALYRRLAIAYRPPFGDHTALPLHPQ